MLYFIETYINNDVTYVYNLCPKEQWKRQREEFNKIVILFPLKTFTIN